MVKKVIEIEMSHYWTVAKTRRELGLGQSGLERLEADRVLVPVRLPIGRHGNDRKYRAADVLALKAQWEAEAGLKPLGEGEETE